jgi:7-cyano-7-deazaguanine synthase
MKNKSSEASKTFTMMISGGIDSVAMAYHAKASGLNVVSAVFFDYGQEAAGQELHSARAATLRTEIPFEAVNVSGLRYLFYGLLDGPFHPLMAECSGCGDLLAPWGIAATYSVLRGVNRMLVGIVKDDLKRIPGITDYIEHFNRATSSLHGIDFQVVTPFIEYSKSEVIKNASKDADNLVGTWCCFGPGPFHCGKCEGCQRRIAAFKAAKIKDKVRFA